MSSATCTDRMARHEAIGNRSDRERLKFQRVGKTQRGDGITFRRLFEFYRLAASSRSRRKGEEHGRLSPMESSRRLSERTRRLHREFIREHLPPVRNA